MKALPVLVIRGNSTALIPKGFVRYVCKKFDRRIFESTTKFGSWEARFYITAVVRFCSAHCQHGPLGSIVILSFQIYILEMKKCVMLRTMFVNASSRSLDRSTERGDHNSSMIC